MSQAAFEPATPARDRPQTHALDRAATVMSIRRSNIRDTADTVVKWNIETWF